MKKIIKNNDLVVKSICFYILLNRFLCLIFIPVAKIMIAIFPKSKIIKEFIKIYWAGESINDAKNKLELNQSNQVNTILESGLEIKDANSESINKTFITTIKLIRFMKKNHYNNGSTNIAFKSLSIFPKSIVEKRVKGENLSQHEQDSLLKSEKMLYILFKYAAKNNVKVYVDAEYNWYNVYINDILSKMMAQFNKEKAIIYFTVQTYLKDSENVLNYYIEQSKKLKFIIGVKVVRGAYLDFERTSNPASTQPCKNSVDHNYLLIAQLINLNIERISALYATHNIHSIKYILFLREQLCEKHKRRIEFACLYGIGDNLISEFSGSLGVKFNQYVPFGKFQYSTLYFLRRLEEGTLSKESFQREYNHTRNVLKKAC